eukprot:1721038-Pleurochrysis_carterae.AAC.7
MSAPRPRRADAREPVFSRGAGRRSLGSPPQICVRLSSHVGARACACALSSPTGVQFAPPTRAHAHAWRARVRKSTPFAETGDRSHLHRGRQEQVTELQIEKCYRFWNGNVNTMLRVEGGVLVAEDRWRGGERNPELRARRSGTVESRWWERAGACRRLGCVGLRVHSECAIES